MCGAEGDGARSGSNRMRSSHLVGHVLVLLFLCCGPALAQAPIFVRRSAAATPAVMDLTVVRQQRVEVGSVAALVDPDLSRTLQLEFFPDVTFRAVRERLEPTNNGMSWIGRLEGYPESTAVFVVVAGELAGHIYAPFGFFRIQRERDGGYLAQQIDQTASGNEPDDAVVVDEPAEARSAPRSPWRTLADNGSVVDVMVMYTRDALAGWTSEVRARAAIDLVVAETNQAFRNSGVNTSIRLVYSAVVDYAESADSSIDLGRLQSSTDGFLDELHMLRDRYAADLVTLITEQMTDACGSAYINGPRNVGLLGFGVVKRSCTANGRSFSHELGHNLGANHDWFETTNAGAFSYSKGYVNLGGRFLDLMAYPNLCNVTRTACTQLLQYSNPAVMRDGVRTGVPAGTSLGCTANNTSNPECDADAGSTFNSMAAVVAGFRDSQNGLSARQILPGGSIRSPSGRYRLAYQSDGNLVLYDDQSQLALWSAGTGGTKPGRAVMQGDGNFVIYDAAGVALWASSTTGNPAAYIVLQDDGNLVIYRPDGQPVWNRLPPD